MNLFKLPVQLRNRTLLTSVFIFVVIFVNVAAVPAERAKINNDAELFSESEPVEINKLKEMAYQPTVVLDKSDLWSADAVNIEAQQVKLPQTWPSELARFVTADLPAVYRGELQISENSLVEFDQGGINVFTEADTFDSSTHIEFTSLDAKEGNRDEENVFYHFELKVRDTSSGQAYEGFEQPVRLILDFNSIDIELTEINRENLQIAYRDEKNSNIWHHVPFDLSEQANTVSVDVSSFAEIQASVSTDTRPSGWEMTWSPPTVSEFSGAATYSYPINVPAGRNGLQPSVALSYNSRSLDGALEEPAVGPVAHGWSMAQMSILRSDTRWEPTLGNGGYHMVHPDRFSLVLNGVGYDLEGPATTYADPVNEIPAEAEYEALGNPSLKIWRRWDNTNQITYWTVTDGNGTTYRFGDNQNAQTWHCIKFGDNRNLKIEGGPNGNDGINLGVWQDSSLPNGDYCPAVANSSFLSGKPSPSGWQVTTIEDYFGNTVNYQYVTFFGGSKNDAPDSDDFIVTRNTRISDIYYNYKNNNFNASNPEANAGSHVSFKPASKDPVQSIYLYHGDVGGSATPIGEYRLTTSSHDVNNCEKELDFITLDGISFHAGVDNLISTPNTTVPNDGYSLPTTTFSYDHWLPHVFNTDLYNSDGTIKWNKINTDGASDSFYNTPDSDGRKCYQFPYLSEYDNGYGGKVSFDYLPDWRQVGGYRDVNGVQKLFPEFVELGFSYFVTEQTVNDGYKDINVTTYDYGPSCYAEYGRNNGGGGHGNMHINTCYAYNASDPKLTSLSGFEKTTVTVEALTSNYDGVKAQINTEQRVPNLNSLSLTMQPVSRTIYQFEKADKYILGRQENVQSGFPVSSDLTINSAYPSSEVQTAYDTTTVQRSPMVNSVTTINKGGGSNSDITTKKTYIYNDYGRPTSVKEYIGTTIHRTTLTSYDNDTVNWLLNRVDKSRVYSGNATNINSATNLLTETRYKYEFGGSEYPTPVETWVGKEGVTNLGGANSSGFIITKVEYDSFGNVFKTTDGRNSSSTIVYDADYALYPVKVTNALGHETEFSYYGFKDANGTLQTLQGFQEQPGLLRSVTDANDLTTYYEYDPFGRFYQLFDPLSYSGTFTHSTSKTSGNPMQRYGYFDNSWNNASIQTNPAGGQPFSMSVETRPQDHSSVEYSRTVSHYNGLGQAIQSQQRKLTLAQGASQVRIVTSQEYDGLGQVVCQTAPYSMPQGGGYHGSACSSHSPSFTTYDYKWTGDTIAVAPDKSVTQVFNRNLSQIDADLTSNNQAIPFAGPRFVTSIVDAEGYVKTNVADAQGNLEKVFEYTGDSSATHEVYAQTKYNYDALNRLTSVIDADNNTTTIVYDALGRKTSMDDPDMGEWFYTYDANGNLKQQVDAKNQTLCFWYDDLNRMTEKRANATCSSAASSAGGTWLASYEFDTASLGTGSDVARGMLAKVSWAPDGVQNNETFSYDAFGRMSEHTRVIGGQTFTMEYSAYDLLNRPLAMTYPDGEQVDTTYDRMGPEKLEIGSTPLVSHVSHNALGQMTLINRGGFDSAAYDHDTSYIYHGADKNFRLEKVLHGSEAQSGSNPADYIYTYDNVGNINTLEETGFGIIDFTYDHLYRLEKAELLQTTDPNDPTVSFALYDTQTYSYDEIGNIETKNGQLYGYGSNQPHAVETIGTGVDAQSFEYDDNGNMDVRIEGQVRYDQLFDTENRLVEVKKDNDNGQITTFAYDPSGQRTMTVDPDGTITYFPFPNYEEIHESNLPPTPIPPTATPVGGCQVLQNGGFENNLVSWSFSGSSNSSSGVTTDEYAGAKALKLEVTQNGFGSPETSAPGEKVNGGWASVASATNENRKAIQTMAAAENVNYTVSGYYKIVGPPYVSNSIKLQFLNSNNSVLNTIQLPAAQATIETNSYESFTFSGLSPAGTTQVRLELAITGEEGQVRYDNLEVQGACVPAITPTSTSTATPVTITPTNTPTATPVTITPTPVTPTVTPAPGNTEDVYTDSTASNWTPSHFSSTVDWTAAKPGSSDPNDKVIHAVVTSNWGRVDLKHTGGLIDLETTSAAGDYEKLQFMIYTANDMRVRLLNSVTNETAYGSSITNLTGGQVIPTNVWTLVEIDLTESNFGLTAFDTIAFQGSWPNNPQPTFYVDEIKLIDGSGQSTPVPTMTPTATATTTGGGTNSCSGLVQEAEAGQLVPTYTGSNLAFQTGSGLGASGGQYVYVADGSGDNYNDASTSSVYVDLCFDVATAGDYKIKGWLAHQGTQNTSDSFYIQVGDSLTNLQPTNGYLWHANAPSASSFTADYVTHNGSSTDQVVTLTAGQNYVRVHLREDGALLDKVELEPIGGSTTTVTPTPTNTPTPTATAVGNSCGGLVQEAEAGQIVDLNLNDSISFQIGSGLGASGGDYIYVADGAGDTSGDASNSPAYVEYCFDLPTAGTYQIKGWIAHQGNKSNSDSFFVQINNGPSDGYLWQTSGSSSATSFVEDWVADRGVQDPLVLTSLTAGQHIVKVHLREDGTLLDKLEFVLISSTSNPSNPVIDNQKAVPQDNSKNGGPVLAESDPAFIGPLEAPESYAQQSNDLTIVVRKTYSLGSQPIAQGSYTFVATNSADANIQRDGDVGINPAGLEILHIYTDHLGSASTTVNASTGEIANTRFYPFGEVRTDVGDAVLDATGRGFTGHRENRDIGLTYMNARYYSPTTNRFLSADTIIPDPTNPQSLNRYSYVLNNPVNKVDPTGHYDDDVHRDLTLGIVQALRSDLREDLSLDLSYTWDSVASHDVGTDYDPATAPYIEGTGPLGYGVGPAMLNSLPQVEINGFSISFKPSITRDYHFRGRSIYETRLQSAIDNGDKKAFGSALHGFQDSFSHIDSGYTLAPFGVFGLRECSGCFDSVSDGVTSILRSIHWGHGTAGSGTDEFNRSSPRDQRMIAGTTYWILKFVLSEYGVNEDEYYRAEHNMTAQEWYDQNVVEN